MKTSYQFIVYAGMGGIGTAAHYLTLVFLVQVAHLPPVWATTAGFVVGALVNYILNYRITFASNKRHRETLIKFLLVASAGAIMNAGIMMAGTNLLDLHYLAVQVIATGLVLIFNFLANKYWTFANQT